MKSHYKVIVVGAGMAGCAVGNTLLENGITDFLILEAKQVPGGRVKTIEKDGYPLEMGAQWLHGSDGNPLYSPLTEHNLIEWRGETLDDSLLNCMQFYSESGSTVSEQDVKLCSQVYESIMERIGKSYDLSQDIWRFRAEEFLKHTESLNLGVDQIRVYKGLHEYYDKAAGCVEGIAAYDGSTMCVPDEFDDCGGYNYAFPNGVVSLFDHWLLPPIRQRIQLDTPVDQIFCSDDHVSVTTSHSTITCDHLIVTASVGFLKANHQRLFTPRLPSPKQEAIEKIGFGAVEKVWLCFDEPFWPENDFDGYGFIYDDTRRLEQLHKTISKVTGTGDKWWMEIHGMNSCTTNPKVLVTWISCGIAERVHHFTDDQMSAVLRLVFEHFTSIVMPSFYLERSRWLEDKYTLGSYTSTGTGYDPKYGVEMLQPLCSRDGVPRLLFAGEAYHPTYMSTMHGAYSTGVKQAKCIISYDKPT